MSKLDKHSLFKTIFKKNIDNLNSIFDPTLLSILDRQSICDTLIGVPKKYPNVYNDLEFFMDYSGTNEKTLFSKLNKTFTYFGTSVLKKKMLSLNTSIDDLNKQKRVLMESISKSDTIHIIKCSFKKIQEDQDYIISFFSNINKDGIESHLKMMYFSSYLDIFNKNDLILHLSTVFHMYNPYINIVYPIVMILVPYILYKLLLASNIDSSFITLFKHISDYTLQKINIFNIKSSYDLTVSIISFIIFVANVYSSFMISIETSVIYDHLEMMILKLKNFVLRLLDIKSILDKNKLFRLAFPLHLNELSIIPKLKEFDRILKSGDTLNYGYYLNLYTYLNTYKFELKPLIHYIGEVDCLLSLHTLIHSFNYKLPHYYLSKTPVLFMKEFHHPYLADSKISIVNDICVGLKNRPNNIVLTGPNAGGKSTYIKGILLNIILAQTLGITASKYMMFTPFTYIDSYLNIVDSKGELSLFESEMTKIKSCLESIQDCSKKGQFSIIIIDELCSGTNVIEGSIISYSISKYLGFIKTNIAIVTTHLEKLSELEGDYNTYRNYKMDISIDKQSLDNNVIYTYKCRKGISNVFLAINILKKKNISKKIISDIESYIEYSKLNDIKEID